MLAYLIQLHQHFPNLFPFEQAIGIITGGIAFLSCLIWRLAHKKKMDEKQVGWLFTSFLSGYTFVQGAFLLYCCVCPVFFKLILPDYPVYVAVGTGCAIYLACVALKTAHTSD